MGIGTASAQGRGWRVAREQDDARVIVTLTPNPSLDLTYGLGELARGEVQRAGSMTVEAGGKGINVSRNLVANGAVSVAVAPVGGPSGEQFLSLLEGSGMDLVQIGRASCRERV